MIPCVEGVVISSSKLPSYSQKKSSGVSNTFGSVNAKLPRLFRLSNTYFYDWQHILFHKGFMVASAHKRCGDHDVAFREYEKLQDQFPENEKVLRCLVAESKANGQPSYQYEDKLDRLLRRSSEVY